MDISSVDYSSCGSKNIYWCCLLLQCTASWNMELWALSSVMNWHMALMIKVLWIPRSNLRNSFLVHAGQRYNKDGILTRWWTTESLNAFRERQKCFSDQYSKYEMYGFYVSHMTYMGNRDAWSTCLMHWIVDQWQPHTWRKHCWQWRHQCSIPGRWIP